MFMLQRKFGNIVAGVLTLVLANHQFSTLGDVAFQDVPANRTVMPLLVRERRPPQPYHRRSAFGPKPPCKSETTLSILGLTGSPLSLRPESAP